MVEVVVGQRSGEQVQIEILGRQSSQETDSDDGVWLACRVSVRAGAFSGRFSASLRDKDFSRFLVSVRELNETLAGEAALNTDEGQIRVAIRRTDSLGPLRVTGTAVDVSGTGNRLAFTLAQYDQTQLPDLIRELEEATAV